MKEADKPIFLNREISWLHFNNRVLQESANPQVPLIERLKFLGIFSSNMDEFFRVRVATLLRMSEMNMKLIAIKEKPETTLKRISKMTASTQSEMEENLRQIIDELKKEHIFLVNEKELTEAQIEFVKNYYDKQLEDAITPIMLSGERSFPEMRDAKIYLFVRLRKENNPSEKKYSLIEIPGSEYSRFLELPDVDGNKYLMMLDDVIRLCMPQIFQSLGYDSFETYTVKITRDSEMEIESELGEGIMEKVTKGIKSRRFGLPLRFVYDRQMPEEMKKIS